MNVHKNARLTAHSRADLVRRVLVQRLPVGAVAEAFGVSIRTVRKWVGRYQAEGAEGLKDRSSRPRRLRKPTPAEGRRGRRLACHRQPHPQAPRPQPHQGAGTGRAGAPL